MSSSKNSTTLLDLEPCQMRQSYLYKSKPDRIPFVSGVMSIYLQVLLLSNLAGFLFHYGTLVCVSDLAIAKQLFDSFSDAHERIYA